MEVIHAIQHAGHRAYNREIRYSSCPGEILYGKKEEIWTTIIILVQTDVSLWAVNSTGESTIVKWKYACRYGEKLHNWNMLHRMQWSESHQKEINEETKQQSGKVSNWKTRMSSGNDGLNEQWGGNWEMRWGNGETFHPHKVIIQIPGMVFSRSGQPWRLHKTVCVSTQKQILTLSSDILTQRSWTYFQSVHGVNLMLGKCRTQASLMFQQ